MNNDIKKQNGREVEYWVVVASYDHIQKGIEGGFVQACHGKLAPLKKTSAGDGILCYSPKKFFQDDKRSLKHFTAIGTVVNAAPYQVEMFEGFAPYRIDVDFVKRYRTVGWQAVREYVHLQSKLRFGFAEIAKEDFAYIQMKMLSVFS